jgi:hypothetical protein
MPQPKKTLNNVRKGQSQVKAGTDEVLAWADVSDFIWRAKQPRKNKGFSRFCP